MKGGPFGACIVKAGRILALGRNMVLSTDATAHAEINAIRRASKALGTFDLRGATIYSTTEPCPMCFSAIHWARIKRIVYGTNIADAARIGFNEMPITNKRLKSLAGSRVILKPAVLRDECRRLFHDWATQSHKKLY
jgi:guanine deaminase